MGGGGGGGGGGHYSKYTQQVSFREPGRTDVPTFIFFLDILHVKKFPIIQQVTNNTLYFYGLNRIFNVCSFP